MFSQAGAKKSRAAPDPIMTCGCLRSHLNLRMLSHGQPSASSCQLPAFPCSEREAGSCRIQSMRLAWFSPMPPVPSGVADCSADLVVELAKRHTIDVYVHAD